MNTKVVIPWHNAGQLASFLIAWGISADEEAAVFQHDKVRDGCARTKNRGIAAAIEAGAEVVIILDDDCYPESGQTFTQFIQAHEQALNPQPVEMFAVVTDPPSRGTPYFHRTIEMPVAASMGFWTHVGDYDAPGQLVHSATKPMDFKRQSIHGRYFPLCGMNLAFRVSEWPWCQFIDVPRFDDVWQGFLWQRRAFADGKCFNLAGPIVRHSRQSNVWQNLQDEAKNLERNETLWQVIHCLPLSGYEEMKTAIGLP